MAVAIVDGPLGLFDPDTRDKASLSKVLKLAMFGQSEFPTGVALAAGGSTLTAAQQLKRKQVRTAQMMLSRSFGRRAADFTARFTTSNADALANVFALSGASGQGVTFPAGSVRTISMILRSSNDADRWYQEVEQEVYGNDGTTPVLGDPRLINAFMLDADVYLQLGRTHLKSAQDGTEATTGMSSSGFTTAALTNGTATLTTPPGRAARVIGVNFAADTYAAGTGCVPHVAILDGDGSARIDVAAADDGLADTTPGTGVLDVAIELWPEPQVKLALSTTTVQVHANCSRNDIFTHQVEVFIGPARVIPLGV